MRVRPRTRGPDRARFARLGRLATAASLTGLAAAPALASGGEPHRIHLAVPIHGVDPLTNVNLGLRPDRLLKSSVPGPVEDTEQVEVAVGPTGAPTAVTDLQRLVLHGSGPYIVRELGPARDAASRGQTAPPVLELGTVVWQGFSPGRRALAALLTLDPGIEAARLPMRVQLRFHASDGRTAELLPGSVAPAKGTVTVTLTNATTTQMQVETGTATPAALAGPLGQLLAAAQHRRPGPPPSAGDGLPRSVPAADVATASVDVVAPLAVTGRITAPGGAAAVQGPGTTPTGDGVALAGTLTGSAAFTVAVDRGQRVGLDLSVQPWLDPRTLGPPAGAGSWTQWARSSHAAAQAPDATTTLVTQAATAARAAEYTPYLQADVPGPDLTTFRYATATAATAAAVVAPLHAHGGAIVLAVVAALAIVGNAELLRRQL